MGDNTKITAITAEQISIVPLLKSIEDRFNRQPDNWKKIALGAMQASADQYLFKV